MRVAIVGATGNVGTSVIRSLVARLRPALIFKRDAGVELLEGLRESRGMSTPPLDPHAGGPLRAGELASGVGTRAAV